MSEAVAAGGEPMAFAKRMKEFFGLRPDQTGTGDFIKEIKELSLQDRVWFANEFNRQGMPTVVPTGAA